MVPAQLASDLLAYSTGSLQISWASQQELKNIFRVGTLFLLLFIKRHMRGRRIFIRSSDTLRCLDDLKLKGHRRVYTTVSLYCSSVLLQMTQQCLHTSVFKARNVLIVMFIMLTHVNANKFNVIVFISNCSLSFTILITVSHIIHCNVFLAKIYIFLLCFDA